MAPQQRRDRSRRLTVAAVSAAVTVALAAGPGFAAEGVRSPGPPAPEPAAPTTTAPAPTTPSPATAAQTTPAHVTPVSGTGSVAPSAPAHITPAPTTSAHVTPAPSTAAHATATPVAQVPTSTPSAVPVPAKAGAPPFGAFLDSGPLGVARIAGLSHWLGGTELKVGHTYLPGGSWRDIEGPPGFLDVWARWRREKADRMLVLNVPMQEHNEEDVPDDQVRELLRAGASGAFDQHFRALAERLVELRVPDTVIVLGWEMNGTTYTHRCGPDPEAWKSYWNRIVTTMRSVPGQRFRFDFAPSRGLDAVPWTACYPGDDTVDIIGMDSYDQPTGETFDEQVTEPYGLRQHVDFAKAHGKPISYPEWGLFRNGDDPEYMRRMLAWIDEHKPLYNTLTDYCPHGVWQCADNPRSSQVYRAALNGLPAVPTAPATPTPTPTPQPPADCSPLNLGDWIEYWLGGKLCLHSGWWSRGG